GILNGSDPYQSTYICGMIGAMTCSSCGAYLTPSVRFCSNCGAPASDPEATRIARLQSRALEFTSDQDLEHTVFTVRPLLLIPAYYNRRRNMVRYTVTDSKLQNDTGLIARTTKNIPLSKVQDVTVSATIPQRIMGFGDIIIDN